MPKVIPDCPPLPQAKPSGQERTYRIELITPLCIRRGRRSWRERPDDADPPNRDPRAIAILVAGNAGRGLLRRGRLAWSAPRGVGREGKGQPRDRRTHRCSGQ